MALINFNTEQAKKINWAGKFDKALLTKNNMNELFQIYSRIFQNLDISKFYKANM